MSDFYILDGHETVLVKNGEQTTLPLKTLEIVERTSVCGDVISTIFSGLHFPSREGRPMLFHTLVFGGPLDLQRSICSTWDEAIAGHRAMVQRVKAAIAADDSLCGPAKQPDAPQEASTKMIGCYILVGRKPVPAGPREWLQWSEKADLGVSYTRLAGADVITIFVGLDRWENRKRPLVFHTSVLCGPMDGEKARYSTWDEAVAGHEAMVERVRAAIAGDGVDGRGAGGNEPQR